MLRTRQCCGGRHITPRQQEVLVLVARGFTTRQLARQIHVGEKTASRMVSDLLVVTGARNRAELIALSCHADLLDVERWPPTSGESTCLAPIQTP